ncbi:hypothetical protein SNE40_020545 [Patella caerulea]|uniref:PiggyBac transposable element-derived protein domain-containing protein n=1 Tax=Patella caerulea TaxID=87958 RepID=A0AAN8IZS2_PATCE
MIRFKGRSSIKQYNPLKPIKRGYKLWVRADSDGYISNFDIYQGKLGQDMDDSELSSLGEKVVTSMCSVPTEKVCQ